MLHYFHNLTFATFATFATLTFSIHLRISEKSCTFAAQSNNKHKSIKTMLDINSQSTPPQPAKN